MNEPKFFRCNTCGNLMLAIYHSGVTPVCCGQKMEILESASVDAAREKHVPATVVEGDIVKVNIGSVDHPMVPEHYIEWVYLLTKQGGQLKPLSAGEAPTLTFALAEGDEVIRAYAYCNIHGLWND